MRGTNGLYLKTPILNKDMKCMLNGAHVLMQMGGVLASKYEILTWLFLRH